MEEPKRVVFLDIDGVLNGDLYVRARPATTTNELWTADDLDPENVATLNRVVEETAAKFVLSSSWRHHHTLDEMRALLRSRGFSGELVDVTPRLFGETRGAEIRTWLRVQRSAVDAFAVLDDEAPTADLAVRWVRTDPNTGVTTADVERLIGLLKATGS